MKKLISLLLVLTFAFLFSSCGIITDSDSKSEKSFTNKFGTPTTICAHSGCREYIASSGDTNCCTKHSRRCLECGCYIDEDAMWCITCIKKAAKQR